MKNTYFCAFFVAVVCLCSIANAGTLVLGTGAAGTRTRSSGYSVASGSFQYVQTNRDSVRPDLFLSARFSFLGDALTIGPSLELFGIDIPGHGNRTMTFTGLDLDLSLLPQSFFAMRLAVGAHAGGLYGNNGWQSLMGLHLLSSYPLRDSISLFGRLAYDDGAVDYDGPCNTASPAVTCRYGLRGVKGVAGVAYEF